MLLRKRPGKLTDDDLMKEIVSGSEAAFAELLARHQARVHDFAFRFLGDREGARDVAQETFLRLFRSRKRYRPGGELKAYLLRISRNLCIDAERKKKPVPLGEHDDPAELSTPLSLLKRKEAMARLAEAVRKLPESQRTAILLRHTEGMSYAGIAEVMGVSVSAVESLLVRGRKKLRNHFEKETID